MPEFANSLFKSMPFIFRVSISKTCTNEKGRVETARASFWCVF